MHFHMCLRFHGPPLSVFSLGSMDLQLLPHKSEKASNTKQKTFNNHIRLCFRGLTLIQ